MKRTLRHRVLTWVMGAGIAGLAVLLLARGFAEDKAPPKPPASIVQNASHEPILDERVNAVQQAPPNAEVATFLDDGSKFRIEAPTKKILAGRTVPSPSAPGSTFINPKVEPGKVRWHKTFADACSAAGKSGKPVLLFQMMGHLDERFC